MTAKPIGARSDVLREAARAMATPSPPPPTNTLDTELDAKL